VLACISGSAGAQLEPAPAAPDWLAGHWCGKHDGDRVEELWLARGDTLLEVGTTVHGDALVAFEYARIEPRAGGVVYVAQPGGQPPVEFALIDAGPQRLVFENPGHDFPQQVSYWRDADGLHAQIAGPGDGGEQRVGFDYIACPEPLPG
jgi:hypothetical protein